MATELRQKQGVKQSPQKMLLSTMIESTQTELEQLLRREVEENLALEFADPDSGYEATDSAEADDSMQDEAYADDEPQQASAEDGALSDDERGDKLELEHPDDEPVDTSSQLRMAEDEDTVSPFDFAMSEETFREELKGQINMLEISSEERYLAHYIIDCLDENGYLSRPLDELVDDLEFNQHHLTTEEDLEYVLVEIVQQELEPSGIGARNLRECLLLQAQELHANKPVNRLANLILEYAFDDLVSKRYDVIEERFGITRHQALVDALRVIRRLNPKPGNMQPVAPRQASESRTLQIRPDYLVTIEDNELLVTLNDDQTPQVRISIDEQAFADELKTKTVDKAVTAADREKRDALAFMNEHLKRAHQFIDALEQRRVTMLSVMRVVVSLQRDYFLTGELDRLKPMTLQDVASHCDYDISTISRVTSDKYAATEFGTINLSSVFNNAVGDTTQAAVIEALSQLIESEDKRHPYTDQQLSELMGQSGTPISRRTVVKYREKLGLGSARERVTL